MAGGKGYKPSNLPPILAKAGTQLGTLTLKLLSRIPAYAGMSGRARQRFLRFTFAIFSSTAQTEAVSCAPKPLFFAFR